MSDDTILLGEVENGTGKGVLAPKEPWTEMTHFFLEILSKILEMFRLLC